MTILPWTQLGGVKRENDGVVEVTSVTVREDGYRMDRKVDVHDDPSEMSEKGQYRTALSFSFCERKEYLRRIVFFLRPERSE